MTQLHYDQDADMAHIRDLTVGVLGYGSQGHAHALNLRDAGIRVLVANREDRFAERARADGFEVCGFDAVAREADVLLFLVPDQAQPEIYAQSLQPHMKPGCLLVFAHGYALRFKTITPSADTDVAMLAPRMPGYYVRQYFQQGGGVPAFADVAQDATGRAWERLLALSKAIGFARAGVLRVDYRVEAELDLFIEQFFVASIVKHIHAGFEVLLEEGYPDVPALMELYASGELAEVLKLAASMGIGQVFQQTASPTCQFGIATEFDNMDTEQLRKRARRIIRDVREGTFTRRLDAEGAADYPRVQHLWERVNGPRLTQAQEQIREAFRTPEPTR